MSETEHHIGKLKPTRKRINEYLGDKTMNETVEADLLIELNIVCPNCGKYFDLMKHEDLNEEGGIIKRACPDGYWSDEHNKFEEDVDCPTCEHKIQVRRIAW